MAPLTKVEANNPEILAPYTFDLSCSASLWAFYMICVVLLGVGVRLINKMYPAPGRSVTRNALFETRDLSQCLTIIPETS
jgi:hypothetical protein